MPSGDGHVGWLRKQGVEKVTVQHIAAMSRKRVRDVEFILDCEAIHIEPRLRTVKVEDLLRRWPHA